MAHAYILTIDVGTSSTKTALWSEEGQVVCESSVAYTLGHPTPVSAEIDATVWWRAVCTTTRSILQSSQISPSQVAGIGVDGVGWTMVPIDANGTPLFPALIWLDRRAQIESNWLAQCDEANRLIQLCVNPIDPAYITPKLLWLKHQHPDIFERTFKFLTCSGYLVAKLTGEFTCDFTQAYGYHFFDLANKCWDATTAHQMGVPLAKMPMLCATSTVVGKLTTLAAEEMGLSAGIPVMAGGLDAAFGALGAGVTRVGQTNDQGGQAGGMGLSVDRIVVEPQLIFSHHVLSGQYLLQSGTVGGGSLNWFRGILDEKSTTPFAAYSTLAEVTPPGAHGLLFIPYMAGERTPIWNTNARGVFFGLSYATTRGDMIRAIMEGCAFAVYHNLVIAEAKGVRVQEWLGSGGATQSAVWCQIKADVSNRPFVVARMKDGKEGGHLLGLFAVTAGALGITEPADKTVNALLTQRTVFTPSAERHALYQDYFTVYRELTQKLLSDFDHLAHLTSKPATIF